MIHYRFLLIFFITAIMISAAGNAVSQDYQGNVFVVTTMERAFPEDGTMAEFDSLNQLYTDKVIKKNNLILSSKALRHWWGHNNRDYVMIYEVASWDDVIKANQMNEELFEKAWATEEARKEFNDAYNKYFTGKHSDEIYQEDKTAKK